MEFLPIIGIALLFWLFIIRPTTRRQKELRTMQSSLTVGAEIVLTSGVYGTVRGLEDDHLRVEIADGVVIKVARAAVGQVVPVDEPETGEGIEPAAEAPDGAVNEQIDPIADERRSEEN